MFAPQKNSFFENSDDVVACDLWFGPPQSKILATPKNGGVKFGNGLVVNEANVLH